MSQSKVDPKKRRWTPAELRQLPRDQLDAILRDAAERAEKYYRNDPSLTDFEAFGEEDLYVDSTDTVEG
jgi:hypothetical protein